MDPGSTIQPCGLIVDWLRSCYRTAMIVRTGDTAILVDWYFADPDAKCLDIWTPFRSHNMEPDARQVGNLGEQPGPRPWRNGRKPSNGWTGDDNSKACALMHSDWWLDGLGAGDDSGPFNADLVPECCLNPPTVECNCGACNPPAVFTGHVESAFFCPSLDGTALVWTIGTPTERDGSVCSYYSDPVDCNGTQLEFVIDIYEVPDCNAKMSMLIDGEEVAYEGAGLDLCNSHGGTATLAPLFNLCCNFLDVVWSWD